MTFNPKDKVKITTLGPWHDQTGYVTEYVGQVPDMIGRHMVGKVSLYRVQLNNGTTLPFTQSEMVRI